MIYCSLHHHSTLSYGDGFGSVYSHVKTAFEYGMTHIALTEHGHTSSHAQLEKYCAKFGINPLYGCEIYIAPPNEKRKFHQTIIAQDDEGIRNLYRMVTESWKTLGTTSKSKFPTVHWDNLKAHSRGLVVLSGCADSLLSCTLLGGKSLGEQRLSYSKADYARARRVIERYQAVFGDRYHLETQRFNMLERTCVLNPAFALLAEDTGAKLTATSDCHYTVPKYNKMQTILHAAHRGSTVEKTEASWEYECTLHIPSSDQEILDNLRGTGLTRAQAKSAIQNTADIAASCTAELPKNKFIKYPVSEDDWKPW